MPARLRIVNRLPAVLRARGLAWTDLGRRTLLSGAHLARLRGAAANPRLGVAGRVAAALDLPVERLWRLAATERRR